MISGGQTIGQTRAVAKSFAWAKSSLFAARTTGTSSDDRSPTAMRQNRSSRAHGVADLSALVPHSSNLFVHRIGEKNSQ
jgi:hypothetical protein